MKQYKIFTIIMLLLLTQPLMTAMGLSAGDYHEKFWGGGLNIWVHYPEEAKPGDTFKLNVYILSSKYPRGNQVEEVKAKITVLTTSSSSILYDNVLLSNTYMQNGVKFNTSIPITLPGDARWFMTIQMDTVSYQNDMTNRQEAHVTLDTTQIRTKTYYDLEQQIIELQAYNNLISQKYNDLQAQIQNLETTPESQLETDYLTLLEDYLYLTNLYNQKISYNQTTEPDLLTTLMELGTLHQQLVEELETTSTQLEQANEEKMGLIQEHEEARQSFIEEKEALINEKNSVEAEFEEYKATYSVSQEEYDRLESSLGDANNTRNIMILVTVLSIAAIISLYVRRRPT